MRIVAGELEQKWRMAADQELVWSPSRTPASETAEPIPKSAAAARTEDRCTAHGEVGCKAEAEPPSAIGNEEVSAVSGKRGIAKVTDQVGPSIQQVYDRYLDNPSVVRSTRTLLAYRSAYGRLIELISPETPIRAVTREVCREVLDTLRYLPPNAIKRYCGLSGREAAARGKAEGLTPMGALTINGHIQKLSAY